VTNGVNIVALDGNNMRRDLNDVTGE